ncbi:hypothetical protein B0O99DRAFT_615154 [Bisporella sp. PMI_857]|nr:hypothetical protein B0O99DRAFT_615154 [Bisporella sp. PMI_857]
MKYFLLGRKGRTMTFFLRSLEVMSRTLRRDVYSLNTPGFFIDQVKQRDPDPLAAARYVTVLEITCTTY